MVMLEWAADLIADGLLTADAAAKLELLTKPLEQQKFGDLQKSLRSLQQVGRKMDRDHPSKAEVCRTIDHIKSQLVLKAKVPAAAAPAEATLPPPQPVLRADRSRPLKLLFCHGNGGSSFISESFQIAAAAEALKTQVDCPQGEFAFDEHKLRTAVGLTPEMRAAGLSGELEMFGWFDTETKTHGGTEYNVAVSQAAIDAAVDQLEAYIVAQGGYDGMLGFSQGFSVLQELAERLPRINANAKCVRKVSFMAGWGVTDSIQVSRELFGRPNPRKMQEVVHTQLGPLKVFICTGSKDGVLSGSSANEMVSKLQNIWTEAGAVVKTAIWEGDHRMPPVGHKCYQELNAFV